MQREQTCYRAVNRGWVGERPGSVWKNPRGKEEESWFRDISLSVGSMEFITRFKVFKKFVFRGFGMEWKRDLSDFF